MLFDCNRVGEYIYVDWLWYCRWLNIFRVLVIAYILNEWWWCGELFVWTYALLWVICSCIHDWWWHILYPKCKTDVKSYIRCFCCIEGEDLEVIWYRMHQEESKTLHAFEWLMSRVIIEHVTWWICALGEIWWMLWFCGLVYMYIGGFC